MGAVNPRPSASARVRTMCSSPRNPPGSLFGDSGAGCRRAANQDQIAVQPDGLLSDK
jgi:hypothetical protein